MILCQDRLGSTTNLTDKFGRVVGRADYNEWGEITYREALSITSSYRRIYPQSSYTSHDWDDVLGMYYAKARFYSAEDKRFVSMDPVKGNITQPLSLVAYVYCVDNPLRWVDPLGLRLERQEILGGGQDITPPKANSSQAQANRPPLSQINPDPQPGPPPALDGYDSGTSIQTQPTPDEVYTEYNRDVLGLIDVPVGVVSAGNPKSVMTAALNGIAFANYLYNRSFRINGIINGQMISPVKDMRYCTAYMDRCGCGLIAIYNAFILLDNPQELGLV